MAALPSWRRKLDNRRRLRLRDLGDDVENDRLLAPSDMQLLVAIARQVEAGTLGGFGRDAAIGPGVLRRGLEPAGVAHRLSERRHQEAAILVAKLRDDGRPGMDAD